MTLKRLRLHGSILDIRKARKGHKCDGCGLPIEQGTEYYEITIGGGGVRSFIHPDRTHIGCENKVLKTRGKE